MKKKLIALLFGASSLTLGGDAFTNNIPVVESKEVAIAGEVVKVKEVNNVVEAEFSWRDATPIKVSYDQGEPTLTEKVKDKRDASVITETVTNFDGGFKVDILLDKIPASNIFCYTIVGAENYDFFYQPPLTEQEIAEGVSRPPEVVGSYAVYHKTLKDHVSGKENYATGKVMHIPRPQVWSMLDVDTKVWADMQYDNGQLCVTVPQDFLDKAQYPVRVDPTFGYTTLGASSYGIAFNDFGDVGSSREGDIYTPSESGTINSISVGLKTTSGGTITINTFASLSLIDGSGANSHTQTAGAQASTAITTTATFFTINMAGESFSASTNYILNTVTDAWSLPINRQVNLSYDSVTSRNSYGEVFFSSFAGAKESPWTNAVKTTTLKLSIYATYTAGGGGGGDTSTAQTEFWFD